MEREEGAHRWRERRKLTDGERGGGSQMEREKEADRWRERKKLTDGERERS